MRIQLSEWHRCTRWLLSVSFFVTSLWGQQPEPDPDTPMPYDPDTKALLLARQYLEGGDGSRPALLEALQLMGWGVRDVKGVIVQPAPVGADTGLAMREDELEELLWKPNEQPAIRLISVAQAISVPFKTVDPEELAQSLVETIRKSAESDQPQQRFWARFIIALGRVGAAGYDLSGPGPVPMIPPDPSRLKTLQEQAMRDPRVLMDALRPTPLWTDDDPVLAPSPRPTGSTGLSTTERDRQRMAELSEEMGELSDAFSSGDETRIREAQQKMNKLGMEMNAITTRMQASSLQQMSTTMNKLQRASSDDEDDEDEDDEEEDNEPRFLAEWRDQPLSFLQVTLIARVLVADLRLSAAQMQSGRGNAMRNSLRFSALPLATMRLAQAGGYTPIGQQVSGAAGDIWATGWGKFTGDLVTQHFPDSNFNNRVAGANAIMAWLKTIVTVIRQNLLVEVQNSPLVRTKTRSPGERRTARVTVKVDLPKADTLKAIRAATNLTSVNIQVPDGGPIAGAKVSWRLTEGGHNNKYQTKNGGWEYKTEFAVVQFAAAGGKAAYVSSTDSNGVATITIEGVPQKKNLSSNVRPYPRRAAISVEVTMKVGNMTQDITDAFGLYFSDPVSGGLTFLADMVLRTSLFFQKGRVFEVTDWKEPAWQGEFEITIKGSGSKREKSEKGGPEVEYRWSMDRYVEGRMHTPDWAEEEEETKGYDSEGRHKLEIDGDRRYFRLKDSSSARSTKSHNRYEAVGPLQIQPPGYNQLATYSRAEPSGSAELLFTGNMMRLELNPFFGAECLVARSENNAGRTSNRSGPEYLSLLGDGAPASYSIVKPYDPTQDWIEGTETFDFYHGNLPYVPSFPVEVIVTYRLWRNNPPPKNK